MRRPRRNVATDSGVLTIGVPLVVCRSVVLFCTPPTLRRLRSVQPTMLVQDLRFAIRSFLRAPRFTGRGVARRIARARRHLVAGPRTSTTIAAP